MKKEIFRTGLTAMTLYGVALGATGLTGDVAHAQRDRGDRGEQRQERRERVENMTPEERQQMIQQRMQNMTPEQRQRVQDWIQQQGGGGQGGGGQGGGGQGGPGGEEFAQLRQQLRDQVRIDWVRQVLTASGFPAPEMQDAIVAFIQTQETARRPLLAQAYALSTGLLNPATTDDTFKEDLAAFRKATEEDQKRYETELAALNEKIDYTGQPRLETVLSVLGVVGYEVPIIGGVGTVFPESPMGANGGGGQRGERGGGRGGQRGGGNDRME